ncbi:hypothetical protein LY76DRAFT_216261 [Colletotrichum caudatum]|nr:hypothetical protein LY76DRAFT_216261 [Colletotrichum caudatum]
MLISRTLVHLPFLFASVSAGVIDTHDHDNDEWSREVRVRGTRSKGGVADASLSGTEGIGPRDHSNAQGVLEGIMVTLNDRDSRLTAAKPSATPDIPFEPLFNRSKTTIAVHEESSPSILSETSAKHGAEPAMDAMAVNSNHLEPRGTKRSANTQRKDMKSQLAEQLKQLTDDLVKCVVCVHICRASQEQAEWPLELLYPRCLKSECVAKGPCVGKTEKYDKAFGGRWAFKEVTNAAWKRYWHGGSGEFYFSDITGIQQ